MNKVIKAVLFLVFAVGQTIAQNAPQTITTAESEEVLRIAHAFSDQILKTKDIRPLTRTYFIQDYPRRALLNDRVAWGKADLVSMLVSRKTAKKVGQVQLRRFIEEENTFMYLSMLYAFSRHASTDPSDDPQPFPKQAMAVMRKDKFFRTMVESESDPNRSAPQDDDDPSYYASSPARFRQVLTLLLRLNPMMRSIAKRTNAGQTKEWENSIADFTARFHYFDPEVSACDDECFGFPKGTRIFTVNVPVFQLAMVRVAGKMQILRAIYYTD